MSFVRRTRARQSLAYGLVAALLLAVVVIAPATLEFDAPRSPSTARTVEGVVSRVLEERVETSPRGESLIRTLEVATQGRLVTVRQELVGSSERVLAAGPGERVLLASAEGPSTGSGEAPSTGSGEAPSTGSGEAPSTGLGEAPGEEPAYFIVDRVRRSLLVALAAVFALLVVGVGGWQGARSLVGLVASFLVILRFVVPGVLAGYNPVVIAAAGSLAVMAATLTLTRGASARSAAAFIGTAFALVLTVLLASGTFAAARIGGLAEEELLTVGAIFGEIDPRGLLLAGVVIGALGVLDDVAMAQASTVFELRRANPTLGRQELFSRAMVVGRDHIASTVNTLVLAYVGASLPLLLLLTTGAEPLGTLINREVLALEVIRALTGSIGLVASVPFTTGVAAVLAARLAAPEGSSVVELLERS